MTNRQFKDFIERFKRVETDLEKHLRESSGIKAHLHINTALTSLILAALLAEFVHGLFK